MFKGTIKNTYLCAFISKFGTLGYIVENAQEKHLKYNKHVKLKIYSVVYNWEFQLFSSGQWNSICNCHH